MQMYLIGYYNDTLPAFIVWVNLLSLISYFVLSFYSIIKTMNLQKTKDDLEQEKQYNKLTNSFMIILEPSNMILQI